MAAVCLYAITDHYDTLISSHKADIRNAFRYLHKPPNFINTWHLSLRQSNFWWRIYFCVNKTVSKLGIQAEEEEECYIGYNKCGCKIAPLWQRNLTSTASVIIINEASFSGHNISFSDEPFCKLCSNIIGLFHIHLFWNKSKKVSENVTGLWYIKA